MNTPLVSICSITYNHAPFIRQCLDGFLMQQCNFPIEIIINDDCSTDGTTEIIREYVEKYPDKIFPIFHEENLYSQGVRGMFQKFVFPKARGKYVALCEGDDYWTDPLKLQKQVDFLESHPDYSMCFHKAVVVGNGEVEQIYQEITQREYFAHEILSMEQHIPTASIMARKEVLNSIPSHPNFRVGDVLIHATSFEQGKVYGFSECMSAYRKHQGGWTMNKAQCALLRETIAHFRAMNLFYPKHISDITNRYLGQTYAYLFRVMLADKKVCGAILVLIDALHVVRRDFCLKTEQITNNRVLKLIMRMASF